MQQAKTNYPESKSLDSMSVESANEIFYSSNF